MTQLKKDFKIKNINPFNKNPSRSVQIKTTIPQKGEEEKEKEKSQKAKREKEKGESWNPPYDLAATLIVTLELPSSPGNNRNHLLVFQFPRSIWKENGWENEGKFWDENCNKTVIPKPEKDFHPKSYIWIVIEDRAQVPSDKDQFLLCWPINREFWIFRTATRKRNFILSSLTSPPFYHPRAINKYLFCELYN